MKADDGPDGTVIDFTKRVYYNDCIWDSELKRFRFFKVILSQENWQTIQGFNEDKDMGYYTYYFWRLHGMHHLLSIFSQLLANVKGKGRGGLLKKIGQLPLQVIEVSVLFKDYSQLFVPKSPFKVDSECWGEIKGMSSEFIVRFK